MSGSFIVTTDGAAGQLLEAAIPFILYACM